MATKKPKTLEGNPEVLQATLDRVVAELAKSDKDRTELQQRCRHYEDDLMTMSTQLMNAVIKDRDAHKVELQKAFRLPVQEQRIRALEDFIRKSVQSGLNFTEASELLKGGA